MADQNDKLPAPFDKEKVYDEQIAPLLAKILDIAKEHKIPTVAVFQYALDDEGVAGYCTSLLIEPETADPHMRHLAYHAKPRGPEIISEMHVTKPDGSKTITIERVGG